MMQDVFDLSRLEWSFSGWTPNLWMQRRSMELGENQSAEFGPLPVAVPGSVQQALKDAGLIPDWNYGLDARLCEWVENRHWIFRTELSDIETGTAYELVADGLDYSGWVVVDGAIVAEFRGAEREHVIPLIFSAVGEDKHVLEIVFDTPPRFLGQFGHTSRMSVGKARYYYTWDWIPRLVQIGIAGNVILRKTAASRIVLEEFTSGLDYLRLRGDIVNGEHVTVRLRDGERLLRSQVISVVDFRRGITWRDLSVEPWQPNGCGPARLYDLDLNGQTYLVGFRRVEWLSCLNAPKNADPWLCEVNGRQVFLQGINWTPIRPNYADVDCGEYRKRLEQYRDMGVNLIRVWGGAMIEKECFYELCDEYGLMVWQEFPLCSSGLENLPPSDVATMAEVMIAADYYLRRLSHHSSLIMWCGGNELQRGLDGRDCGCGSPCSTAEPLLEKLAALVMERDPSRRFVPASASGPRFCADAKELGQGLHWDVHGPWKIEDGQSDAAWRSYWERDDALFRSEVGCPGASPAALIREFAGTLSPFPCSVDNPLWRYPLPWWNENRAFTVETGHSPESLEEYVDWSQRRQARILGHIAAVCKDRFPECGGIVIWMGHDAFPVTANTSILDYHGNCKPAAAALREVFLR